MKLNQLLALIMLTTAGSAFGQTDSLHDAPRDTAPRPGAAPPASPRVLEYRSVMMPGGHKADWLPCGPGSARMDVCDTLVRRINFDPADGQLHAWSCRDDNVAKVTPFLVEHRSGDVLLSLPKLERQYIMSRPNRCGSSCPGVESCLRLTKKRSSRTDPPEVIYLRLDTMNNRP